VQVARWLVPGVSVDQSSIILLAIENARPLVVGDRALGIIRGSCAPLI
jgi:hypothetical protein